MMRLASRILLAILFPLVPWLSTEVSAQEELAEPHITVVVAAAMTRESKHPAAAKLFFDFIAAEPGQKEVLAMDKPPALAKLRPDYLKGVRLAPVDWTLSESFEEHNKIFREIFWKN